MGFSWLCRRLTVLPHQVLGPDCALRTDQETGGLRGFSDLFGVKHGLRKRRGQDSNLGWLGIPVLRDPYRHSMCGHTHTHSVVFRLRSRENKAVSKRGLKTSGGVCMCAYTKHPVVSASEGCVACVAPSVVCGMCALCT